MSKKRIQFQRGLSLASFHKQYGSVAKCRRVLFQLKWPGGFACPRCAGRRYSSIKQPCRYQCLDCHHQTTVTVGTLLENTKLPLTTWFLAAYLITQSKNSVTSLRGGSNLFDCNLACDIMSTKKSLNEPKSSRNHINTPYNA